MKETKSPTGYNPNNKKYPFSITENGQVVNITDDGHETIENTPQTGNLEIIKRSSDGKLEGFSFKVTGTTITGEQYEQVFKTDKDGKISISGLRVGTYTVHEIADEENVRYNLPADKTVIVENGKTAQAEMFNQEIEVPFEITKTDISTGEPIPNTSFRIRNSNGDVVVEGKTDKDGIAKFVLVCGKYTYQEFDAPTGYIIDSKEYPFEIKPDDTIVKAEMTNIGTGTLELTKTDISTGKTIPDCGVEILDSNKNVIFRGTTDSNGKVVFSNLSYGKYYYREYNAPNGYILDETPYEFEIKTNGQIVKCVMTNEAEKTPGYITTGSTSNPSVPSSSTPVSNTGDNSNTLPIMALTIISALICLVLFGTKKKADI